MKLIPIYFVYFFSSTNKMSGEAKEGSRGGLFGAGGRFKGGTDPIMEKFNESISFDQRCVATCKTGAT